MILFGRKKQKIHADFELVKENAEQRAEILLLKSRLKEATKQRDWYLKLAFRRYGSSLKDLDLETLENTNP